MVSVRRSVPDSTDRSAAARTPGAPGPAPTLSDVFAGAVRCFGQTLTSFDVACLLAYAPTFTPAVHRAGRPLRVTDWGERAIASLLRVAQAIPDELRNCGLLPRLDCPPRRAFEYAARRFTEWVEWTRRSDGDDREVVRRTAINTLLRDCFSQRVRPEEVLSDLRSGFRAAGRPPSQGAIEEVCRAMRASGREAFFISRKGTWRLGKRQVRDFLELGLPRRRARYATRGKDNPTEFPVGSAFDDDAQRAELPDQRSVPLLAGLERLEALERLERVARLSARERLVLELSADLRVDEVGWGSREHHRRLTAEGFQISQPGLLKLCDRVRRKLSG